MISVQNRHRLLSGSNLLLLVLFTGLIASCTSQKGLGTGDVKSKAEKPKVYNPRTGNYETVEDALALVDTVQLSEAEAVVPPIGAAATAPTGKKASYDVALMIPLGAPGPDFINSIDPKPRRFLNYYSGVQMAINDLASEGIEIKASVLDTREDPEIVESKISNLRKVDAIIGPYNRTSLAVAAGFASEHKIPVISPWTPSIRLDQPSDYFVQVVPGLASHASAAMQFLSMRFDTAKFFLVATPENQDESRMSLYLDAFKRFNPDKEPMEKLVVDKASVVPDSNDLTTVYIPEMTNVFVMPYYLRSEEDFVNSFLRKVHAEHGETEVYVIGLPQWMNFRNVNPDYLEGLMAYVTAVQFVDNTSDEVRSFNSRFLETYGTVPEQSAWKGYELTMYVGHALDRHGSGFLQQIKNESETDFRFRPVYTGGLEGRGRLEYYENKGIDILQFRDQQFRKIQ